MARTAITPSEHFTSYQPSPLQQRHAAAAAKGAYPPVPKVCVVTGGSGCVGQRLVEMLVERGAERVVSLDIAPKPPGAWDDKRIEYVLGDLRDPAAVAEACKGAGCVWHNGAAVGPYHPEELYDAVNHIGSVNVVEACRKHGVPKIVMSSSPSTRFDGSDVDGLTEAEMPPLPQKSYLQAYAASKADGELKVRGASCDALLTCAVAPHQVYGPRDNLFLPNLLEVAGKVRFFSSRRPPAQPPPPLTLISLSQGSLRVFGNGKNRICFSHVDNYCHGLIIAEHALKKGAACCGKFYIVTDGDTHAHKEGYCNFWETLDAAVVGCGFPSVTAKFHLPWLLMMALAYVKRTLLLLLLLLLLYYSH